MAAQRHGSAPGSNIVAGVEGAAGVIALNRPSALNALTAAMRATIAESFAAWARDPQVYAAVIVSAADRAFCAGGDVREMVECARRDAEEARRQKAEGYKGSGETQESIVESRQSLVTAPDSRLTTLD